MRGNSLLQERTRIRVFQERAGKLAAENLDINDEDDSKFAVQSPHISCLRPTPRESLLELAATTQTQARRQNGRCEYFAMVNVYDCHSASRSSSWKRSFGELHSTKNQPQRTVKQLLHVTKKLVRDRKEIQGIFVINWQQSFWKRTTLLTDRAVELSTAKTYGFSDSVLCMRRILDSPVSAWKKKNNWFMNLFQCRELDRIDAEPMEFEWKVLPGFTTLQILAEIQNMMTEIQCELELLIGRIIITSMYNDIVCGEKGEKELCIANSKTVAEYATRFAHGHWSFLGLGSEKKGAELILTSRTENGIVSLRT